MSISLKRTLIMIMTVMMVISFIPGMGTMTAYADDVVTTPIERVTVGYVDEKGYFITVSLQDSAVYYVNGATEATSDSTVDWNAYFDKSTGTLTYRNYDGAGVDMRSNRGKLNIVLEGDNRICGKGQFGINTMDDINISSNSGGTLTIECGKNANCYGIDTDYGSVSFNGNPKISVKVETNGTTNDAFGIRAEGVYVLGQTELSIEAITADDPSVYGIYANSLTVMSPKEINIRIDSAGCYGSALYGISDFSFGNGAKIYTDCSGNNEDCIYYTIDVLKNLLKNVGYRVTVKQGGERYYGVIEPKTVLVSPGDITYDPYVLTGLTDDMTGTDAYRILLNAINCPTNENYDGTTGWYVDLDSPYTGISDDSGDHGDLNASDLKLSADEDYWLSFDIVIDYDGWLDNEDMYFSVNGDEGSRVSYYSYRREGETGNSYMVSYRMTATEGIETGTLCDTVDYTLNNTTGTLTLIPTGTDEMGEKTGIAKTDGDAESSPFFNDTRIKDVIVQEGITEIHDFVFSKNKLNSVSLPSTLETVTKRAFEDCTLIGSGFTVDPRNEYFYSDDGSLVYDYGDKVLVRFFQKPGQTEYAIPSDIHEVGWQCFENVYLDKLTLRGDELYVNDYAITSDSVIEHVVIEEGVTEIGQFIDFECHDTHRDLPKSLEAFGGQSTFIDDEFIENFNVASGSKYFEAIDGVLYEKDGSDLILKKYPNGKNGTAFNLPENVTKIGYYRAIENNRLEEIDLSNVSYIADGGFKDLNGTTVTVRNPECVFNGNPMYFSSNIKIRGVAGSTAEDYANSMGFAFIQMKDIRAAEIGEIPDRKYSGSAIKPDLTLTLDGVILNEGTEYSVTFSDNVNAGTATVTIRGKGDFGGTLKKTFKILPKEITPKVTLSATTYTYDGKVKKPTVTVKDGTKTLKTTDYTVSYASGRKNIGTYNVKVTLKGNYKGEATAKFTIKGDLSKAVTKVTVQSIKEKVYTGSVITPTPTVKAIGSDGKVVTLKKGTDYTLKATRKSVGKATLTITGKGKYKGTKKVAFRIIPKGTTVSGVTASSKALTVKWKKLSTKMTSSRITGYEVQVATNSAFTKNEKTVMVKGYSNTSKKITKLLGGKKYYVRIRTYMKVDGTIYNSKWTKWSKTIKTKE